MIISNKMIKEYEDALNQKFNNIVDLILCPNYVASTATIFDEQFRPLIYEILFSNISGSVFITTLADLLIKRINYFPINVKIRRWALEANLIYTRRDIVRIHRFIINIMEEFR